MSEVDVSNSRQGRNEDPFEDESEHLADFAFMEGKKVKWALKLGEGEEFYLYLKDVDALRTPLQDLLRELLPVTVGKPFRFLELPPEVQLQILQKLSIRDLCSCRLTCFWMNELIVNNWHSLPPRKIGCVDYIPGCDEVWGLYFDYMRKLDTFINVVVSRLVLYYGMISPSLLLSLAQALARAQIALKALIIYNCRCNCGLEEFITFVKTAHVEVLAIDVFDMMDFGRSLLSDEAIYELENVLIFSNGDDVMSGIVVDPFYYETPIDLHGVCRLLTDWGNGSMEILYFHMKSDTDWAVDVETFLNSIRHVEIQHGNVLRNIDGQELVVEVEDCRITLRPAN